MRPSIKRFVIRLGVASVAALTLAALIVLPLTQASVRLIGLLLLPVQLVIDRVAPSTYCYGPKIPREAFWELAWRSAIWALPIYTAILYVPAAARRGARLSARSIRFAFRDRWRAGLYAVVGGLLGAYLGFIVWLRYGSAAALAPYVLAGAATASWALALGRAAIADVRGLRRSHS
jgi:hypothetical protein